MQSEQALQQSSVEEIFKEFQVKTFFRSSPPIFPKPLPPPGAEGLEGLDDLELIYSQGRHGGFSLGFCFRAPA